MPQIIPRGIFPKAPVGGGVIGVPGPTDAQFGTLEWYVDSRLGLGAFADGANVTTWADQSGHSPTRDSVHQVGWNDPVMIRSGSNLTPKGTPTVRWAIPDAVKPQGLASSSFVWPATTNGYTFYFYGRVHQKTTPAWAFLDQDWFAGGAGNAFGNSFNANGAGSIGFIDNNGTGNPHAFNTEASIDNRWLLHTIVLPPPNGGTVPMRYYLNGVSQPQISGPANWNSNVGANTPFGLGNSLSANISMRSEMGFGLWYSRAHSQAQISLLSIWASIYFGY